MPYSVQSSAAALQRAFNDVNATPAAYAATVADLTADTRAAAAKFDDGTLTDLALSTKVLTNMGILPSTVTEVKALEAALADYFTASGKSNRGFVVLQVAEILSGITATTDPLFVYYGAAATAWNTEVAASVADATPTTLALTTASTDNVVGGSAADIFSAITAALSTANTLSATDKVSGGAGNDTFKIDVGTNFSGFTTGSVAGVEALELTNVSNSNRTFDATGVTGVTSLAINATAGSIDSISNLGTGVKSISLTNQTGSSTGSSANFATTFATGAAEIAGTSDTVDLSLSTVGGTSTAGKATVALNLGSFENVKIASTGANVVSLANTAGLKTVAVTGDGTLSVTAIPSGSTLTSFDAGSATGAITAVLSAATGQVLKTIATGSGKDAVTIEAKDVVANASISGGAGDDTLTIGDSTGVSAVEYKLSGFETLAFSATGNLLVSGTNTTGVTTVSSNKTAAVTTGDLTLVNMGSGALTVQSKGAAANALSTDGTGAATISYTATVADATTSSADSNTATFTAAEASTLSVSVGSFVAQTGAISANKATSVNVTVATSKDNGGTERASFGSTVTAAKATSLTITADGTLASTAVVDAAIATTATVTNGGTAGTLKLVTPKLTSLTATTASALTLDPAGFSLGALETLSLAANKGTSTLGALPKVSSMTLSGTGTTTGSLSSITTGNLGGANDYNFSLTASGLKGNVSVGTINVNPGYDVSINTSATTGDFTTTGVNGTTVGRNVTITHAGSTGSLTTANVAGTGTVTIDAAGTKSASIGTVAGDVVNVYINGTTSSSSVSTITAKSAVDLKVYDLAASTQTINAAAAATGLTVKLAGGVLVDDITVSGNGVTTLKNVTVTGNLGASTDKLTVSNASGAAGTIDTSGVTSYDGIVTGSAGADTILTGAGADTIRAGAGADTITGGSGVNTYVFGATDSPYTAPDTITDLKSTDVFLFDDSNVTKATEGAGSANAATISAKGVATFALTAAADKDSLLKVANLIDAATSAGQTAAFAYGSDVYMFIDTGSATNDLIIKVTGSISLPLVNLATASTGLSGFSS